MPVRPRVRNSSNQNGFVNQNTNQSGAHVNLILAPAGHWVAQLNMKTELVCASFSLRYLQCMNTLAISKAYAHSCERLAQYYTVQSAL